MDTQIQKRKRGCNARKKFEFPKKGAVLKLVSDKKKFHVLIVEVDGNYILINVKDWKAVPYYPLPNSPAVYKFSTISSLLDSMMQDYDVYIVDSDFILKNGFKKDVTL